MPADDGLTDEDRAFIAKARREAAEYDEDADESEGLPADKQDFPIGIRPDGTVNRVDPA